MTALTSLSEQIGVKELSQDEFFSKSFPVRMGNSTWYSLYSLEILIAEVTGRPMLLSLADVIIQSQAAVACPQHPGKSS